MVKTNLRIMTSNIWGDYFGNPVTVREDQLTEVYARYSPDVLGFQEATVSWWESKLFVALKEEYTMVDVDKEVKAWYATASEGEESMTGRPECNQQNFVPLFYKTAKYDCLEKGWEHYDLTPDPSKAFTWAVLKDKETGKVFGVFNTHFWWMSGPIHDELRKKNSEQMLQRMQKINEKYQTTVIAFGDMNSTPESLAFRALMENDIHNLRVEAPEVPMMCSYHDEPELGEDGIYHSKKTELSWEYSLDHIVSLGAVDVLNYQIVEDQDALDASDHSPVYADIVLE